MASWHQRLLPLAACIAVIATTPVLAQAEIKKPADQAVSPLTKDLNTSLDKLQKPTAQKARCGGRENSPAKSHPRRQCVCGHVGE